MGSACSSNQDLSTRANYSKIIDETTNYYKYSDKTDSSLKQFTKECELIISHLETYDFTQSQAFVKEGLEFGLTNDTDIPNGGIKPKSSSKSPTSTKLLIGKFARDNATLIIQYWNRTLVTQSLPTDIVILLSQFFDIENPCDFAFQQVFPMVYLLNEMKSLKEKVTSWFADGEFRSHLNFTPIEIYRNDIEVSFGQLIVFFERYYQLDQLIMKNKNFLQEMFFYVKRYYAGTRMDKRKRNLEALLFDINGKAIEMVSSDFMGFITEIFNFLQDPMSKGCFTMMILVRNTYRSNRRIREENKNEQLEFMLSFFVNSCLHLLECNDVKSKQFKDEMKVDEKQALVLATAMVTGLIIYDCYSDVFGEANKTVRSIDCVKMIVNNFEKIYAQECTIDQRSVIISKLNELACAIKYGCMLSEKVKGILHTL